MLALTLNTLTDFYCKHDMRLLAADMSTELIHMLSSHDT